MKKFLFLISFLFSLTCYAELEINITGGHTDPMPIAISDFGGSYKTQEVRQIIQNNLESSGLFRVINKDAYIQQLQSVNETPNFSAWRAVKAQALLMADVNLLSNGRVQIAFRLWDVYAGQSLIARKLTLPVADWRRLAHIVADNVYSRMTGEKGYFDTRFVYVAQTGTGLKKIKRIAMIDQDGANAHYLTDGKSLVLTPRFSPDLQKIAYMTYEKGKPRVLIMDLATGENQDLGVFQGMSFAPRFSPDGKKLLYSQSVRGNAEIFVMDLATKQRTQLTFHPSIDTSACFSPDGQKIVFNSDRSGSQQLYVMESDGRNVKRISFGKKGSYATPVWSPRGDYIAFTKIQEGAFYIGVMKPDGSGERLIASGFLVESPSWSPNGRVLSFYKQQPYSSTGKEGESGLYTIDMTGYNERHLPTPTEALAPEWSSLLFEKKENN